jgi:hypothetical protein
MQEFLRPWKLVTFLLGLALLIFGAFYFDYSDWDVGISVIMALLTYLTAPWSTRSFLERRYRAWPLALFYWYFTVDGCYWIYHTALGHVMVRDGNFWASTPLYFLMGCVWLYRGSVREFVDEVCTAFRNRTGRAP